MLFWSIFIPIMLYYVLGLTTSHRFRANKFAGRKDMSFAEIFDEYLRNKSISKNKAESSWSEVAKAFKIPPQKLRPTDSFAKELHYHISWFPFTDLNADFYAIANKRLRESNPDPEAIKNIKMLGDYIEIVSKVD
jgi:hypothetical protein